jgi:hypothetical protein
MIVADSVLMIHQRAGFGLSDPATPDILQQLVSQRRKSQTNKEGEFVAPDDHVSQWKEDCSRTRDTVTFGIHERRRVAKGRHANSMTKTLCTSRLQSKPSQSKVKAERQANNGVLWYQFAHDGDDDLCPLGRLSTSSP